MVAMATGVDRG